MLVLLRAWQQRLLELQALGQVWGSLPSRLVLLRPSPSELLQSPTPSPPGYSPSLPASLPRHALVAAAGGEAGPETGFALEAGVSGEQ